MIRSSIIHLPCNLGLLNLIYIILYIKIIISAGPSLSYDNFSLILLFCDIFIVHFTCHSICYICCFVLSPCLDSLSNNTEACVYQWFLIPQNQKIGVLRGCKHVFVSMCIFFKVSVQLYLQNIVISAMYHVSSITITFTSESTLLIFTKLLRVSIYIINRLFVIGPILLNLQRLVTSAS